MDNKKKKKNKNGKYHCGAVLEKNVAVICYIASSLFHRARFNARKKNNNHILLLLLLHYYNLTSGVSPAVIDSLPPSQSKARRIFQNSCLPHYVMVLLWIAAGTRTYREDRMTRERKRRVVRNETSRVQ